MDDAAERALLAECHARIAQEEGVALAGSLFPWVNATHLMPDLRAETGYAYTLDWPHDDQTGWLATRTRPPVAMPYARPNNDLPPLHGAKWTPAEWADTLIDQFDEMRTSSRRWPLVFNVSLHSFLVGGAFRLRHLRWVLAHIVRRRGGVWLTRPGVIASYCSGVAPPARGG